jgi:hypothetical protein
MTHGSSACFVAGGRTEVGDDVGRRGRDVRQSGDGRHRRGGLGPQDVVDRFSVAARAPAGGPGREDLRQRRDHKEGAAEVGDRHVEEKHCGHGIGAVLRLDSSRGERAQNRSLTTGRGRESRRDRVRDSQQRCEADSSSSRPLHRDGVGVSSTSVVDDVDGIAGSSA